MRRVALFSILFIGACEAPLPVAPDDPSGQDAAVEDAQVLRDGGSISTLAVRVAVQGEGVVRSAAAGIACPTDCGADVEPGTVLELEAIPAAGSRIESWSIDGCSGERCVVEVDRDITVRVAFRRVAQVLHVEKIGAGSGTIESIDGTVACGAACDVELPFDATTVLVATAAKGSRFVEWTGACSGSGSTCPLTLSGALEAHARFEEVTCALDEPDAVTVIALYGQSLAVGTDGRPALSVEAPYPEDVFVLDQSMTALCAAREGGPCGPWPDTETSRTAIAATWRHLRGDGKFIVNNAAAGGLAIGRLAKGTAPYQKLIDQITASSALAATLPGAPRAIVRSVAFVHGPSDESNDGYAAKLRQLRADVDADVRAITQQTSPVHFFVDQTSSWSRTSVEPNVAVDQLRACQVDPFIHCVGPQFQLDYSDDRVHLVNTGYRENGERFGAAMWRTLERCEEAAAPYTIGAQAIGSTIRARFHVADPPLAFDLDRCPEFPNRGFELFSPSVQDVQITEAVVIDDRTVELTVDQPLARDAFTLRYAWSGTFSGGGDCRVASPRSAGGNLVDQGSAEAWPTTVDRAAWAMTNEVPVHGGVPAPASTATAYLRLGGPTEHVAIVDNDLGVGTKSTISAWVRFRAPAHNQVVVDKGAEWSIRSFDNGRERQLVFHSDGFTSGVRSSSQGIDVMDGQWHHVLVTYDAPTVSWFVDCTEAGSGTGAAAIPDLGATLRLGHDRFAADVDLADVAVFDRPLEHADVFSMCRAPIDLCVDDCSSSPLAAGPPRAWWRPEGTDDPSAVEGFADRGAGGYGGTGINGVSIECGWPSGLPCGDVARDGGVGEPVDAGARDGGL